MSASLAEPRTPSAAGSDEGDFLARVGRRADRLLEVATSELRPDERRELGRLARMMEDPVGKAFTLAWVDQVFRAEDPERQTRRLRGLVARYGLPRYLSSADRMLIRAGLWAARFAPGAVMRSMRWRMRADSRHVILDGDPAALTRHVERRTAAGFAANVNHLGEAVLGEDEALRRLAAIEAHLRNPAIDYVSVKISAIYSQIHLVAWEHSLGVVLHRMRRLVRAAIAEGGDAGPKFVNLDMEEYRDFELTIEVFKTLLEEPEFDHARLGIVLQAYVPDSFGAQQELTAWARRRVRAGRSEIKIRLVKGANLEMERVEAEQHGWHPAPYGSKAETDANFRRMLEYGCRPEHAAAVRLGVASHNLFDVALALTLRDEFGTADRVVIEMLEGMAPHQARVTRREAGGLLLYVPAVERRDFLSAMAYLVRRLDENTAAGNFLRDLFGLAPGTPAWAAQRERFEAGWLARHDVAVGSRRVEPAVRPERAGTRLEDFRNEPDTDFTLAASRAAVDATHTRRTEPLPSLSPTDEVLAAAAAAGPAWEARGVAARAAILRDVATRLSADRFETIACLRDEGRKAIVEADAEVSEAIDFARYYAVAALADDATFAGLRSTPLGVVVVVPPWNFPYAIPAGGVLAALVAGNTVVLKPAPEARRIAWWLARQLWDAGVPRDVLYFHACDDDDQGRQLVTDGRTAAVVLTGAYATADLFRSWKPSLRLYAETSGKNALVVTAQADRELAIKDLVRSAFGHSGQKCSAASLAILEAEVYDDLDFRRQLLDAVRSLRVGPSSDPAALVTPLVQAPGPELRRALTTLEAGEEWLLEPRPVDGDTPHLWSPGIRLGVRPGSWFHRTECFGPVLGLTRADDLDHAIAIQNDIAYGLTAGIHSLETAEIECWADRVEAGNLYVNRGTTGAIVNRQPFGGWKRSCVGPGAKAGGPNYVTLFRNYRDGGAAVSLEAVRADYELAWAKHFSIEHDSSELRAESNLFRYRRRKPVVLRLTAADEAEGVTRPRAEAAAAVSGAGLEISRAAAETDAAFAERVSATAGCYEFLRSTGPLPEAVRIAAAAAGLNVVEAPLTSNGRLELRYWLREQAVSRTLHRYGQISAIPDRVEVALPR